MIFKWLSNKIQKLIRECYIIYAHIYRRLYTTEYYLLSSFENILVCLRVDGRKKEILYIYILFETQYYSEVKNSEENVQTFFLDF